MGKPERGSAVRGANVRSPLQTQSWTWLGGDSTWSPKGTFEGSSQVAQKRSAFAKSRGPQLHNLGVCSAAKKTSWLYGYKCRFPNWEYDF